MEKRLPDTLLPNAVLGVDVDVLASPLGSEALDFPKILFEAPFAPKLEPPNTGAGAGTGAVALLPSSLVAFAAPKIDNGVSVFFESPPNAAGAKGDVPDDAPKFIVGLGADEAPVETNAELLEG